MRFSATVVIQQEENWYVAKCLENNVATQGKSIDEALKNLREALELFYDGNNDIPVIKQIFITAMEIVILPDDYNKKSSSNISP